MNNVHNFDDIKLMRPDDRKDIDSNVYGKARGIDLPIKSFKGSETRNRINNSNIITESEDIQMSEYISRKEFEQFEKRIEDKFDVLNNKIDDLPNRISSMLEDKMKISTLELKQDLQQERKQDKKSIITWTLSGTGLIITIAGIILKLIGLY